MYNNKIINMITAKCCELKRCADQVRSRTDNKDEVLEGKQIRHLNFSPSTKKTTKYSFELFLSINKIVFDFCCLKRRSPCDFAPKTRDTAQGYLKCMLPHIGGPADGWSCDYYVTTQISWLFGGA